MGCDIHGLVECKVNGKWICWSTIGVINVSHRKEGESRYAFPTTLERNYRRFAALAGVRGDGPEAKGMPPDASDTALLLGTDDDYHSHSWLSVDEAVKIFLATEHKADDFITEYTLQNYFQLEDYDLAKASEWRFVFWFDN